MLRRKARQEPLDLTWLEQQAAELEGDIGEIGLLNAVRKTASRKNSAVLRRQPQLHWQFDGDAAVADAGSPAGFATQSQNSSGSSGSVSLTAVQDDHDDGDGSEAQSVQQAAAAASLNPAVEMVPAASSSQHYQAVLASVMQHHTSEAELTQLEKLSNQQLPPEAQQLRNHKGTGQLPAQPTATAAAAAETTEIKDHEGIVETPPLIHQQQEWMAQQLYYNMPPSSKACTSSSNSSSSSTHGGWHRIDVCTGHYHAHAAVIIRDRRFESQSRDLFEYLGSLIAL
jgi:hypothetical protein